MEPTHENPQWGDSFSGVERELRLQNVATQLQLLIRRAYRGENLDEAQRETTTDSDVD